MKLVMNIANRAEVARMSARAVEQLLNEVRGTADMDARCDLIAGRVQMWQGLFPRDANIAALSALNVSLKNQAASGRAGIEVLQCARIVEHIQGEALAEQKRKRKEEAKKRMAAIAARHHAAVAAARAGGKSR
ncbi:MAG: hypothetical protein ACXWML_09610 [Candidatus Binataceae bacterium]